MFYKIKLRWGIRKLIKHYFFDNTDNLTGLIDNYAFGPLAKLLNKHLANRIIKHYGADYDGADSKSHNLDYKSGNLGYGLIHHSLIRNNRPKRVLCIGSMYGYIPFMCALACKENNYGSVEFVDAAYDIDNPDDKGKHNFGKGFWKKIEPRAHFSYLKVSNYIKTYVMTTDNFVTKYPKRKYQYVYIDGDHTYEGVKNDFKIFWGKLEKGGLMLFHDTDNKGYHGEIYYNVTKLIKELGKKNHNMIHFPNLASGLVILQKK